MTATFSISILKGIVHSAPHMHRRNLSIPNRYKEKDFTTPKTYIYMFTAPINAQMKSIRGGQGIGQRAANTTLDVENGIVTHE